MILGRIIMIKFFNFNREYSELKDNIYINIDKVLKNGNFIMGKEVKKFETQFSKYIGTKYGLGVNSGSDALFMAIKALDIGEGDEVISVSNTFISTIDAISRNNAHPVFVDIDLETYCMDISKIESHITDKTRAIVVVHLYGHPADMDPILKIAKKYDLFVIEDCSQAHGAKYKGKTVGSIGDMGCFSFYPVKNLGAYGDGGFIALNDEILYEKLKMMHNYGQSGKNQHEFVGLNSRLDEIQAAILNLKLEYLDTWNNKRDKLANVYNELLDSSKYILPFVKGNVVHVYHLYVIRSSKRDKLKDYLLKNNIESMIHYPLPVHKQNAYSNLMSDKTIPITELVCNQIISLPMNPWLNQNEIVKICQILNNYGGQDE
jgi:dTDP-4-amino-4,6-dideoxygalactose transaminase